MKNLRVFIAGVIQGSRSDKTVSDQNYRQIIAQALRENLQEVEIVDPWVIYPNGETYNVEQAREAFLESSVLAGNMDVLIAYLPEASMGTAVEIWEAYQAGVPVFSISPLRENWVVKLFSSQVFPTLDAFRSFVTDGGLASVAQS